MNNLFVLGGKELHGNITIDGAKNSMVALIPAMLLVNGFIVLENIPDILDLKWCLDICEELKLDIVFDGRRVKAAIHEIDPVISSKSATKYRGSYYFMGALLSRYKEVMIGYPGGCNIGKRPIDYHIEGFKKLGANVEELEEGIRITAKNLIGTTIELPKKSVGATINIVLASTYAKGRTIIKNASIEPEVDDVINFLCKLGFNVYRISDSIYINGKESILESNIIYRIIPDRIEAMTYITLGLLLGEIRVYKADYHTLRKPLYELCKAGALIEINDEYIEAKKSHLDFLDIESGEYPLFPTDMTQLFSILMIKNSGGIIVERIFENRFKSLEELRKMNANIEISGNKAIIRCGNLESGFVKGTDLRGTASLVLAALCAKGESVVYNMEYLKRGYSRFFEKIRSLGADIYLS